MDTADILQRMHQLILNQEVYKGETGEYYQESLVNGLQELLEDIKGGI